MSSHTSIVRDARANCDETPSAQTDRPRPLTGVVRCIVALDRIIYRVARRWLFFVNSVSFVTVLMIFLAPAFVASGHSGLAKPIYAFNGLFCQQRPGHSFYVFGQKMACCQRCFAIYGSMLLVGCFFACIRGRIRAPRMSELAALSLPILVDGVGQMAGFWGSTPTSRVISGGLFGAALIWLICPYLERGFAQVRSNIETLFTRLTAEGRAAPLVVS